MNCATRDASPIASQPSVFGYDDIWGLSAPTLQEARTQESVGAATGPFDGEQKVQSVDLPIVGVLTYRNVAPEREPTKTEAQLRIDSCVTIYKKDRCLTVLFGTVGARGFEPPTSAS